MANSKRAAPSDDNTVVLGSVDNNKPREPLSAKDLLVNKNREEHTVTIDDVGTSYLKNLTPLSETRLNYTEGLGELQRMSPNSKNYIPGTAISEQQFATAQPASEQIGRGLKMAGANFVTGLGSTIINTFDIASAAKTIKDEFTDDPNDFNSSILGISTASINKWSKGVQKRNTIYEQNPESTSPGDLGWWTNKVLPQLGTLGGTAVGAIAVTSLIEAATGGTGTPVMAAKLFENIKNLWGDVKVGEIVKGGLNLVKGMKGSAAAYAGISRFSEATFEGQNNYDNTYEKLSDPKLLNPKTNQPYTEAEKKYIASEGAKVDFALTIAQLPLDILAVRAMIFNPLLGTSEGVLEKGLGKVASVFGESKLGKSAGWLATHSIGAGIEGFESGGIPIYQEEGRHHAMILAGLEKNDTAWTDRVGEMMGSSEFSDMVASGVLGSLFIGPALNASKSALNYSRNKQFNQRYKRYVDDVVPYNVLLAKHIIQQDAKGDTEGANKARKSLNINQAIDRLYTDRQAGKADSYNAYLNFLQSTLDQANSGKSDNIVDLFGDVTPEQIDQIKKEYTSYIQDAKDIRDIYNEVSGRYNANFVPSITFDRFTLQSLVNSQQEVANKLTEVQNNTFQYNSLTSRGKEQYNIGYQLKGLNHQKEGLLLTFKNTKNKQEKANIDSQINENSTKITNLRNRLDELGKDENYTEQEKKSDIAIIDGSLYNHAHAQAIYSKERLDDAIMISRKKVALWNNKEYIKSKNEESITNAKTLAQVKATEEALKANKENTIELDKEIKKKKVKIAAKQVADTIDAENNKKANSATPTIDKTVDKLKDSKVVVGNANLFADKTDELKKHIDTKTVVPKSKTPITETPKEGKKPVLNIPKVDDEYDQADREADMIMSPAPVPIDKYSDAEKEDLKKIVGGLIDQLPNKDSFTDLVKAYIQQIKDVNKADRAFNYLKEGWRLNNKELKDSEADSIYDSLFGNPSQQLDDLINRDEKIYKETLSAQQDDVIANNEEEEEQFETDANDDIAIDNNGQVVHLYDYGDSRVTDNENPSFSILTKKSEKQKVVNPDGTITVKYNKVSNTIHVGSDVDSTEIFDPNKFLAGTKLDIRVPENYNDVSVTIYSNDETDDRTIKFGEWAEDRARSLGINITEFEKTQEFKKKIPILVYKKGSTKGEKGLSFVRDIDWYHPERFLQTEPEKMQSAIDKTIAIRNAATSVAVGENTGITITEKKPTTFAPFKTEILGYQPNGNPIYKFIPLSQANPDAIIAVASGTNKFIASTLPDGLKARDERNSEIFNNNDNILARKSALHDGLIYDIRQLGWKDGKKLWGVYEITPQPISKEVRETIRQALYIFLNKKNSKFRTQAGEAQTVHDKIVKEIEDATGLNILKTDGIRKYLRQFINVHGVPTDDFAKEDNYKDISSIANSKIKSKQYPAKSIGYIVIQGGGNSGTVYIGATKWNIDTDQPAVYANSSKLDVDNIQKFFKNFDKKFIPDINSAGNYISILDDATNNFDVHAAINNKPVILITKDGNNLSTNKVADSYKEYAMNTFTTNIKSENVAKEGETPVYATSAVRISYDLDSNIQQSKEDTLPISNQKIVEAIVETKIADSTTKLDDISEENKKILSEEEQIRLQEIFNKYKNLGYDLDNISEYDTDDLASVAAMTIEEREELSNVDNRIDGLTQEEEYQIQDHILNQITPIINERGSIPNKEIKSVIYKLLKDVLNPLKNDHIENIKFLKNLIKERPVFTDARLTISLELAQKEVDKINDIQSKKNRNIIFKKVKEEIIKSSGIKESKIEEDSYNNDSEYSNRNFEERENWQVDSALSLDPNARTPSILKRFYRSIPKLNKDGSFQKGVFGFPLYYNIDDIGRGTKDILKDTISDYDTMIAKLSSYTHPWIPQLIEKLKNSTQQLKNQFQTDMQNNSLRMNYSSLDITYLDENTNTYKAKNWDALKTGIANQIHNQWLSNFKDKDGLILRDTDDDGNIQLNKEWAINNILNKFDSWLGANVEEVKADIGADIKSKASRIGIGQSITIPIDRDSVLGKELSTRLVRKSQRLRFSTSITSSFQISSLGDSKFQISILDEVGIQDNEEGRKDIKNWLGEFGIDVSDGTLNELFAGNFVQNYKKTEFLDLFKAGGLFKVLYNSIKYAVDKEGAYYYNKAGKEPIKETEVKSLAALEYKYDTNKIATGVYINGKNIFPITQEKFAVRRFLDLTSEDSSRVRDKLSNISFSKYSYILSLLQNSKDDKVRQLFEVSHIAPGNAFQILGKKLTQDASLSKLSDLEYEVASFILFSDMLQGEVTEKYGNTSIGLRMANMYMPTMSDKTTPLSLSLPVLNLSNKELNDGNRISEEVKQAIYEQVVRPEIARMLSHSQNNATNVKGYDNGASLFMFIPRLNNLMYNEDITLRGAIIDEKLTYRLDIDSIDSNIELKGEIYKIIEDTINAIKDKKREVWATNGIISKDKKENTVLKFIDNTYLGKFEGSIEQKIDMAILDKSVNDMIQLSNVFMLFDGDPAQYYKKGDSTKEDDLLQLVKDSFDNIGKRLANQIAPGVKVSQSENERYIQLMIEDRKSIGDKDFIKFVTKTLDSEEMDDDEYNFIRDYIATDKTDLHANDIEQFNELKKKYYNSAGYFNIEASDAQEYTTWQEHLHILERLGRLPDYLTDITDKDIANARKLFSSKKESKDLTQEDRNLIGLVMNPIKPVYTGQLYDDIQDLMRTVYIKSSSFPLIPQLTRTFELDKLRVAMEKIQSRNNMNVRASYQSANKVGAVKNAIRLWDSEGNVRKDILDKNGDIDTSNIIIDNSHPDTSGLILNRNDFRIQQDVPFKSDKNAEDKQTYGTQPMKLLFGDGIIDLNEFDYNGKPVTGLKLHAEYTKAHIDLVNNNQKQLFDELGLDKLGKPINYEVTTNKIQKLINKEGKERGFPAQVLEGLVLVGKGDNREFTLPLWSSINSNKFEALLNSIISNRVAKLKFNGNSYVTGSPEGFIRVKDEDTARQQDKIPSQMVFTGAWDGNSLKATKSKDGKITKIQVFVSSKFRDNDDNPINLLDPEWSTDGKLNMDKFDKRLLNLISFRLPTTGLNSLSQIEIVGFLPYTSGDLMILPSNLTKQKGLDFDVDKENTYQYWHYINKGKFDVLNEGNRAEILASKDKLLKDFRDKASNLIKDEVGEDFGSKLDELADLAGVEDYTDEEIDSDSVLKKLDNRITSKLLQNKIVSIYESVLSNPNPKIQAKIHAILNTEYEEKDAAFIDSLTSKKDENWTALSAEYQKQKLSSANSGIIAKGAYSLDVTFHALAQQTRSTGNPIVLYEKVGKFNSPKTWRFGVLGDGQGQGGVETDGVLGGQDTIHGRRSTASMLNSKAQTGVDNEKLQVLGKVNENPTTFDVVKMFTLNRIDNFDTEDAHSVVNLFLSQPIIKDYVQLLNNSKSTLNEYDAEKKEKIINQLLIDYDSKFDTRIIDDKYNESISDLLGEQNLINGITSLNPKKEHGKMQAGALLRFLDMERYGLAIRGVQTTLNTDSQGLDKSFFDVIEKLEKLDKLNNTTPIKVKDKIVGNISNIDKLVGEYIAKPKADEIGLSQSDIDNYLKDGYYDTGKNFVKPTTYVGALNVVTVATAYNMWKDYLPYNSPILKSLFDEILPIIQSQDYDNSKRTVENKQKILAEFKKYLATSKLAGFIGKDYKDIESDINNERKRLYIDSDTNTSLPTYIKKLMYTPHPEFKRVIDKHIKNNILLNSIKYEGNKDGSISTMVFNATNGDTWGQEQLYQALISLMEVRGKEGVIKLPKIGNKEYTLDTLAQDIINYEMLGNAKQEAVQYVKYIPVQYMNAIGYSYMMRSIHNKLNGKADSVSIHKLMRSLGILEKTQKTDHYMSEFGTQFIQHFAKEVKYSIDKKDLPKKLVEVGYKSNSYKLISKDRPSFIKVYDRKIIGKKKFQLYKLAGLSYNRIPLLGVFQMDEYQFGKPIGTSLIHKKFGNIEGIQPKMEENVDESSEGHTLYSISEGDVIKSVESISKDTSNSFNVLAQKLLPYIENNKIVLNDHIIIDDKPIYDNWLGGWTPSTGVITINPIILDRPELTAATILHEVVHGLTYNAVNPYISMKLDGYAEVLNNAPKYVEDIVRLFNFTKSTVNKEGLAAYIKNSNRTEEDISEYYGYTNITEFMTMALTNKGFQQRLNKIEYYKTGTTLLDKFKDIIKDILQALGIEFDENYSAAHAINAIFRVIEEGNTKEATGKYEKMFKDMNNKDDIENKQYSVSDIQVVDRYNNKDVIDNPNKIYIFGDNTDRKGVGGQAFIRNNLNAFGIATKIHPTNNDNAFMSDSNLQNNKKVIDSDIQKILDQNKPIVFPRDGLGTGLAKLREKAPQTYEYLKKQLLDKFGFNNDSGELYSRNNTDSQYSISTIKGEFPDIQYTIPNTEC